MADEKVNELTSLSDAQFDDNTKLFAIGAASDGELFSGTVGQAKLIFGAHVTNYKASGSEGTTLLISALSGKDVLAIWREAGPVFPVTSPTVPDSSEYIWNGTTIQFGNALNTNERIIIIWKYLI